ncbi:MAG: hypothetical protein IIZ14_06190 [Solobacterium sp.]|nr:hypothetical protein [Solobacterium sp.]
MDGKACMKKGMMMAALALMACTGVQEEQDHTEPMNQETETAVMNIRIGETLAEVIWEDNGAVRELYAAVQEGPLTVNLSMYGGFEQVGALGFGLPHDDVRITAMPGDLVLYQGNQIVVFYGSNTWEYTRLGHIADKSEEELEQLLGNGDTDIVLYPEGDES